MLQHLILKEQNEIAFVKLNRPEVRNAFNPRMILEITQVFTELGQRKDLRALVLSGEGKVFSAGGDLNWMSEMISYSREENSEDAQRLFAMFATMSECPIPVFGIIHGACYGGGLGLLACCDFAIAEVGTQFCFSEVKIGISPAVISSFVLRKASIGHSRPYMLTGRVFDENQALRMGLVHEIAEVGSLATHLSRLISDIGLCSPQSLRETKKLLNQMSPLQYSEWGPSTSELIASLRVSQEGQDGLSSFLNKTQPKWVRR